MGGDLIESCDRSMKIVMTDERLQEFSSIGLLPNVITRFLIWTITDLIGIQMFAKVLKSNTRSLQYNQSAHTRQIQI